MLSAKQFRQFSQQVQFELTGDGLRYVLTELPPPHAPLHSRREVFGHRDTDLVGWPGVFDVRNDAAGDDIRSRRTRVTLRGEQRSQSGSELWRADHLEGSDGPDHAPDVVLQSRGRKELGQPGWRIRIKGTDM